MGLAPDDQRKRDEVVEQAHAEEGQPENQHGVGTCLNAVSGGPAAEDVRSWRSE